MKILIVSAEVAPFSKTGGLADVAGALPRSIREASGCDVRVISPLYKEVKGTGLRIDKASLVKGASGFEDLPAFELFESELEDVKFYFVGNDKYYDRDGLYGTSKGDHPDNAQRFSFFCMAVLAAMVDIGFYPDVIHANDWQTGLIPLYRNAKLNKNHPLKKSKILFSIHNLAYEGRFTKEAIKGIGLSERLIEPLRCKGRFSFIKPGIVYSDAITTVSKRYAKEILTEEYGNGLDNILGKRKKDIYGILNGADYSNWNPATDELIPVNYDTSTLERKLTCKTELLKTLKMDISAQAPLVGSIGRLAWQKGIDVIVDSIGDILKLGAGFILLGKGEKRYEEVLKRLAGKYAGGVGISIGFDNRLAHMIEAGVDMFAMPSRYEPCGLNQMYSLKYGTIPVVRATGGLDDTIVDYSKNRKKGNGFKFKQAEANDFLGAIKRAIKVFENKKEWTKLQKRGMTSDFSWKKAAREYTALYERITA